jgi:anti-sigma factor RsiW
LNHDEAWPLLDPYLDGALDSEPRWAVAAHVAECPLCAADVAERARLRTAVRARLRDLPTPPGLTERIRANLAHAAPASPTAATSRPRRLALLVPAVAALALVAAGVWWVARATVDRHDPALDLAGELAATHAVFAHDDTLLEITGDGAVISSWFADRVAFQVTAPDLPGYELQGARLVTVDGRPATQVVYEDEAARRYVSIITFEVPAGDLAGLERSETFVSGTRGEVAVAIWSDGDLRHALVADTTQAEALRLAAAAANPS